MAVERLILWDLDRTLLEAYGFGQAIMGQAFLRLYGVPAPDGVPTAGRTDKSILRDMLALLGRDESEQPRVQALVGELAREGVVDPVGVRALPGAAAAVAAAAGPTVLQSVLTGNLEAIGRLKLSAVGARGLDLDVAAFGDDHTYRPDLVDVARERLASRYGASLEPDRILIVGDTPLDVEAALVNGAVAVGVATGSYSTDDLRAAGAHVVLPDLTDPRELLAAL
ncbi:HAD hydrolase-like protein [Tsukamurella sp. 8F]|uniref:HAD family hydrolase n=1 Tax=unclassified Tsukamurella TaxID=2633480 RepID=UPI0023B9D39D|nr:MULTISPECIES: HAD hydrolase-like protein [unclassified Tsukamurella]MDF0528510.1 HAD hydrolase-like protein [Tsukamurella sp. 8J]MDF0586336.1 HAD hydrolase-like protein [Tsukamurella sp. 8F]